MKQMDEKASRRRSANASGRIWHVYILECEDGSLYTGIAIDVEKRFRQHLTGKGARYTRSHKPRRLVVSRPLGSQADALRAERALKRLPREKKILALQGVETLPAISSSTLISNQRNTLMNKSELIEIIATEADITKAAAERALAAVLDGIVAAVAKGDTVSLIGFGSFKASQRAERTGKNPQTGAALTIPATTVPKFTAGAGFKSAVAGK